MSLNRNSGTLMTSSLRSRSTVIFSTTSWYEKSLVASSSAWLPSNQASSSRSFSWSSFCRFQSCSKTCLLVCFPTWWYWTSWSLRDSSVSSIEHAQPTSIRRRRAQRISSRVTSLVAYPLIWLYWAQPSPFQCLQSTRGPNTLSRSMTSMNGQLVS